MNPIRLVFGGGFVGMGGGVFRGLGGHFGGHGGTAGASDDGVGALQRRCFSLLVLKQRHH